MDATGVNLNYNFATNWRANYNFHEDTYPGIHSFSEKESQILRDFVLSTKDSIEMVVILRSPTKRFQINQLYITFPWSHTPQKVNNWYILVSINFRYKIFIKNSVLATPYISHPVLIKISSEFRPTFYVNLLDATYVTS